MKKRLFAMLLVISLVAGLLPTTVLATGNPAQFTFVDSVNAKELTVTADLVVEINEGDAPKYFKTVNDAVTAEGASAADYNIKLTYNAGENPKLYLKGAKIDCLGDGKGASAIMIGSESATADCNDLDVDIVVEEGTSTLFSSCSWSSPKINSLITGTLTISSVNDGVLDLMTRFGGQNTGTIDAVGEILLKDANITMHGYAGDPENGYYIRSATGSITIDGGKLSVDTSAVQSNRSILQTDAGDANIVIQNGATVNVILDKSNTIAFNTAGDVIINNSSVVVAITGENSKIAKAAPVIEGYGEKGYIAKGNGGEYNEDNFEEYKVFSVIPYQAPTARFVFKNYSVDPFEMEYFVTVGDAPVYLRTLGNAVTANGATEKNYNIKLAFEKGGKPTVYLNGAKIATYGDGKQDITLTIGSPNAADLVNDNDVDIIVEKNSEFHHAKTYGDTHIMSYVTGTLTITKEKGSLEMHHMMNQGNAAIQAMGDIVLKDITLKMVSDYTDSDKANYICSTNGNIILDGSTLTVTTNGSKKANEQPTYRRILFTQGEGKNIVIQNGSKVKFNIRSAIKAFGTLGDVIIKDSTVSVKVNGNDQGTIFDKAAPVIEGYADGYTMLGDGAAFDAANFAAYKEFSIVPAGQEGEIEDPVETKPETKPTVPTVEATEPTAEPEEYEGDPTAPAAPSGDNEGQSNDTLLIVLLCVCVALIVLANGAMVAVIIIRKKKAAANVEADAEANTEEEETTEE